MPGLSYLGEVLLSFGVSIIYYIMLFITICAKIIIYERNQKQQGKKYANPFISIMALIFVVIGILFLLGEIIDNYGKKRNNRYSCGFRRNPNRRRNRILADY